MLFVIGALENAGTLPRNRPHRLLPNLYLLSVQDDRNSFNAAEPNTRVNGFYSCLFPLYFHCVFRCFFPPTFLDTVVPPEFLA